MKIAVLGFLALVSSQALAGTGGFVEKTCISASGRTVFTFVETDSKQVGTLIVDGFALKLETGGKSDLEFAAEKNMLIAVDNNGVIMSLSTDPERPKNLFIDVRAGKDPRIGTEISAQAKPEGFQATLVCKTFERTP